MNTPPTLATRPLDLLPDPDAVLDELAEPGRALERAARTGRVRLPADAKTPFEIAAVPEVLRLLADGRRAVLALRRADPERVALTPGEQLGLEAVVLLFGRPALLVEHGTFAAPPRGWEVLDRHRPRIETTLRSVGRIELLDGGMIATGFLVAPDVIMTNRHVAEVFVLAGEDGGWTFKPGCLPVIDYIDERGATDSAAFRITGVVGIHDDVRIDLALLRLDPNPIGVLPAGWTPPDALPVAASAPVPSDVRRLVYIAGYPASDNQGITPPEVLIRIFGGIYEVKRLQPGTMTAISRSLPRFSHDCSTLGGNSGSCVVDLETHRVLGLHFSGGYRDGNYAIALWKLARDPLLRDAGAVFV